MPTDATISPPDRQLGPSPDLVDEILAGFPGAVGADPDVYIDLIQATKLLPPNRPGKSVHVSALHRARSTGTAARAPGREGQRISLRCIRRPGGWMTTRRALAEWLAELTADCSVHQAPAPVRTSSIRRRAAERAGRELDKIGI